MNIQELNTNTQANPLGFVIDKTLGTYTVDGME